MWLTDFLLLEERKNVVPDSFTKSQSDYCNNLTFLFLSVVLIISETCEKSIFRNFFFKIDAILIFNVSWTQSNKFLMTLQTVCLHIHNEFLLIVWKKS